LVKLCQPSHLNKPPIESTSKRLIQQTVTRKKKNYTDELIKKDDDFDLAFPMSRILKSDDYQNYLNDPLGEDMLEKASKLFGSTHIKGFYHTPMTSKDYDEVNIKDPPKGPIYPPFLPSVASNAIDVGK
jgi:hypothetical protein